MLGSTIAVAPMKNDATNTSYNRKDPKQQNICACKSSQRYYSTKIHHCRSKINFTASKIWQRAGDDWFTGHKFLERGRPFWFIVRRSFVESPATTICYFECASRLLYGPTLEKVAKGNKRHFASPLVQWCRIPSIVWRGQNGRQFNGIIDHRRSLRSHSRSTKYIGDHDSIKKTEKVSPEYIKTCDIRTDILGYLRG